MLFLVLLNILLTLKRNYDSHRSQLGLSLLEGMVKEL